MAEELGSTRESLAWNPGRETVHADQKAGEPEVFLEPLLWGLFSLGGFITAFLFPITVFLLFVAPSFGLWPSDPAAYARCAAGFSPDGCLLPRCLLGARLLRRSGFLRRRCFLGRLPDRPFHREELVDEVLLPHAVADLHPDLLARAR